MKWLWITSNSPYILDHETHPERLFKNTCPTPFKRFCVSSLTAGPGSVLTFPWARALGSCWMASFLLHAGFWFLRLLPATKSYEFKRLWRSSNPPAQLDELSAVHVQLYSALGRSSRAVIFSVWLHSLQVPQSPSPPRCQHLWTQIICQTTWLGLEHTFGWGPSPVVLMHITHHTFNADTRINVTLRTCDWLCNCIYRFHLSFITRL